MDPRAELCLQRQILANSALLIARELEAGRAQAPFQEKLGALALPAGSHPVRAAILAASPEHAHALLADLLGPDYNVCKVVMPSRLGYSEVLLQERGFLLDSGNGPQEFAEADAFLAALQSTHALQSGDTDLEPLRVKLQGPAHLSGLGLLIPQSLETLRRKPALLSTLADQADWIFLVGAQTSKLDPDIRQTIQLVLEHSVGLQPVMVASEDAAAPPGEEWWKGWKATISLGIAPLGSEPLRARLSQLTAPDSELRLYLIEVRLWRQLENTLQLLAEELDQNQRTTGNRLSLMRDGLTGPASGSDLRKLAEAARGRLAEELESILRAVERDHKVGLAPDGELQQQLTSTASGIRPDDLEQTPGEATIRLSPSTDAVSRLGDFVTSAARQRLIRDVQQVNEGLECTLRDLEKVLEQGTGVRAKLSVELLDETGLWEGVSHTARADIRYKSEMPKPTLGTRFNAARQVIMGVMMGGTILGGTATLVGGDSGSVRGMLAAFMLPLLIVGFLWTYVSFRKAERLTIEREVEKLRDGILAELRRVAGDLQREQLALLSSAVQKAQRNVLQQISALVEQLERERQREGEESKRRQTEQQKGLEQKQIRLRQYQTQLSGLQQKQLDARRLQSLWLAEWQKRTSQIPI